MILLIDNYDSFSYNLYQLIGSIEPDIRVIRNDDMTSEEVLAMKPDAVILSPGPGRPENAGILVDLIRKADGSVPILGVCLGHQAIAYAYGAKVTYAKELMHGKESVISIDRASPIFSGLPEKIRVARYHSLAADPDTFPDNMKVIAKTEDKEVMALQIKDAPVYGLQFHPESIMTPDGKKIIENFINRAKGGIKR